MAGCAAETYLGEIRQPFNWRKSDRYRYPTNKPTAAGNTLAGKGIWTSYARVVSAPYRMSVERRMQREEAAEDCMKRLLRGQRLRSCSNSSIDPDGMSRGTYVPDVAR